MELTFDHNLTTDEQAEVAMALANHLASGQVVVGGTEYDVPKQPSIVYNDVYGQRIHNY